MNPRLSNKKKTQFKKDPEPIITRNEREGNMNYFSEEISKSIVDKIISLTITRHFLNDLNPKFPQLCFKNIKKEIGKYIHCQFISHDRDDMFFFIRQTQYNAMTDYIRESTYNDLAEFHFNIDRIDKALLYDNSYDGLNYWGDIFQPESTRKERNASTQINYARKESIKKKTLAIVPDENLKTEELCSFSPPSGTGAFRSRYPSARSLIPLTIRDKGSIDISKPKNVSANIITHDLPYNDVKCIEEDEDIEQSRKEFFDNKAKMHLLEEEEAKKIAFERKKELNREENNAQAKNSLLNKNVTNDVNCKLVYIKDVIPDSLKIDFNIAKSNSRKIIPDDNQDINDNKGNNKDLNKNNNSFLTKVKDTVDMGISEHINTNQDLVPSVKKLTDPFFAVKTLLSHLALQAGKEEIILSGSSFSLFTPEVGVNILENNQTKIGGRDYYRKYNKYSIENYNQKLRDTLYLSQISLYLQKEKYQQSNSELNFDNKQNDINSQFSNNNISNIIKPSNNKNNISNISNTMMPNQIRIMNKSHRFMNKSNSNSDNRSNSNIKLNTSAKFLSLRAAIDTLDLINEREEEMGREHNNKQMNLFKKFNYKTINKKREDKQSFDEMDKFTRKISMNSVWGTDKIGNRKSNLIPYKPVNRKLNHMRDNNNIEGKLNMTKASSLPKIRIKKNNFNFSTFNFTQSPFANFTRINLNKTKYFSKNLFKVNSGFA